MTRPGWDIYFMIIADAVSLRMSCDRARIGAVIVSPDFRILSTGYGGAPSGWPSCDDVGHQLVDINGRMSCIRTVHAEENAVVTAARHGAKIDGSTLYTTSSPCFDCFKMVAQAGIKRIVYAELYSSARSAGVDIVKLGEENGIKFERLPLLERIDWPPIVGTDTLPGAASTSVSSCCNQFAKDGNHGETCLVSLMLSPPEPKPAPPGITGDVPHPTALCRCMHQYREHLNGDACVRPGCPCRGFSYMVAPKPTPGACVKCGCTPAQVAMVSPEPQTGPICENCALAERILAPRKKDHHEKLRK